LRYPESYHSAPFFPQPIPIENDSQRMFYLYASDYTLNSMLYQVNSTLMDILRHNS